MKIGICINPVDALNWPSLPCDYLEINVQGQLMPEAPEAEFATLAAKLGSFTGRILAANCFLPGDLKVSGPDVNHERLARYADTAFRRARVLGIKYIIFGSGGARQMPNDWPLAKGFEQYVQALNICAPLAEKHGVILAVEPLNRQECNLINTVQEGALAVARVNHPHIRLLVDFFHMARNDESPDDIIMVGPWIIHAHIAERANRTAPGVDNDDFRPYLSALRKIDYAGSLSIECKFGSAVRQETEKAVVTIHEQLGDLL